MDTSLIESRTVNWWKSTRLDLNVIIVRLVDSFPLFLDCHHQVTPEKHVPLGAVPETSNKGLARWDHVVISVAHLRCFHRVEYSLVGCCFCCLLGKVAKLRRKEVVVLWIFQIDCYLLFLQRLEKILKEKNVTKEFGRYGGKGQGRHGTGFTGLVHLSPEGCSCEQVNGSSG